MESRIMCDLKIKVCTNSKCKSYDELDCDNNCSFHSDISKCEYLQIEEMKYCGDCITIFNAHASICRTCKWNPTITLSDHHILKNKLYYQILIEKEFADEEDFRLSSKRNRNDTHGELDAMCDSVLFSSNDDFSVEVVEIGNGVPKKVEESD